MKKKVYTVAGLIFLAGAAFAGVKVFQSVYAPSASKSEAYAPDQTETQSGTGEQGGSEQETALETEPAQTETAYVSPVDFEALQKINPDIYGWITIENTNISFPIVQNAVNDKFYLDHNSDGEYSANGAIFSEHRYNGTDLDDPVTLLYGHHMHDGAMFGRLQEYFTDGEFFENTPVFKIYTPDAEYTYGVFAAVPYSSEHILYQRDFTDEQVFTGFFSEIMRIRDLSAAFREEYAPEPGDEVVILSTCLIADNHYRFLVMGTKLADSPE